MTIMEAIQQADDIRPNPYVPATKIRWLAELDGRAALDIMLMGIEETQHFKYTERDMDTELLIHFPHDGIYLYWLCAKLDYAAGEMNRYNNDLEMFNNAWNEYTRWFARVYQPAQREQREECEAW